MVGIDFRPVCAVPEQFRMKLVAQVAVFMVLSAQKRGPAGGQLHGHTAEMVAGTGKYKGDFPGVAKGEQG